MGSFVGPAARGNAVASNEIGTQVGVSALVFPIRGTQPRPNALNGVLIENAPANVIGGQVPNSGNVIGGNTLDGVVIENYVSGTIPAAVPARCAVYATPALPLNCSKISCPTFSRMKYIDGTSRSLSM